MQRGALLALPLLLAATGLTGCGLLDGSSSLDDALESMPGTITRVTFFDRAAATERVGLDDLDTDTSDEDFDAYVEKAQDLPWRSELDLHLLQMLEAAPFSAQDVEWEAVGYDAEGAFGRVWKMNDDLDLEEVVDGLVDLGFEEDGSGDSTTLTIGTDEIDPAKAAYLVLLQNLVVVPDEHLMITGPLAAEMADVVADDAESAVDTDAFEDLIDSTDDVEVADLARNDAVCSLGSSRVSPEQLDATGVAELGRPDKTAFLVHGDEGDTRSVLVFGDEDAAEDDAGAREEFLAEGTSPISGVPYSEFGDFEVEPDGEQVRIDIEYDDPRDISAVLTRGDYPSVCVPDAG